MRDEIKIAGVQMYPKLAAKGENIENMMTLASTAAENGADLVVFPECTLTGYMFRSHEEALPYMETVPGPFTESLSRFCEEKNIYITAGLLEKDGDKCYNIAVLAGPEGLIGKYRKIHLPFLGIDRFLEHGDKPFQVYKTLIGNIGLLICYDCNFPESARVMTLMGADILALPTNWPEKRDNMPNYVVITRAIENRVHVAAVNRVGTERGGRFIGLSRIVSAEGEVLDKAGDKEKIIYGTVSLKTAREKHVIIKPGELEIDLIRDRHPEFYSTITEANKE